MTLRPGFIDGETPIERQPDVTAQAASASHGGSISGPVLLDADEASIKGRVEVAWDPALLRPPPKQANSALWFFAGCSLLLISWLIFSASAFLYDQFVRSEKLGIITIIFFGAAIAVALRGVYLEILAYKSLSRVDDLRRYLAQRDTSLPQVKLLCKGWIEAVGASLPDAPDCVLGLDSLETVPEIRNYLRSRVVEPLKLVAKQAGRRAALQSGVVIAVTPSPSLDGIMTAFCGVRLVRQVAQIYGLRPGTLVTLALFRRVIFSAAGVAGVEYLAQSLADHTLQKLPIIKDLAGAVPGTSVAAIRVYRLAIVTAGACSPLDDR